jgi:hypothetical protein
MTLSMSILGTTIPNTALDAECRYAECRNGLSILSKFAICQLDIMSPSNFVNLTLCQLDILLTWQFVNMPFC